MLRRSHPARAGVAGLLAMLVALSATAFACPAAGAAPHGRSSAGAGRSAASEARAAARVLRYWTPARMRSARPLELLLGGDGRTSLRLGSPSSPAASASYLAVSTPDAPPYSVNGRVFVRQGGRQGYCSGTAIDTPTRQLVLTAGHCVNTGPEENRRRGIWSNYLAFVPAYTGTVAPFGIFVGRRDKVRALPQWTKQGNPDYDLGAFLTRPNAEGVNLADAVGGGATIVTGLSRHQSFQTFGYPGESTHMQSCRSPYIGDDVLSNPLPGPPTQGIRCHWAPGASGGGWLIGDGTQIDGISTYLHPEDASNTFGPYFAPETVGKLVRGL